MSPQLKQALFAFTCIIATVATLAFNQLIDLAQGFKSWFIPNWINQPVVPQALINLQEDGAFLLSIMYALLVLGLFAMGGIITRLGNKTASLHPSSIKYSALFALPCVAVWYCAVQENYQLYAGMVTNNVTNLYGWSTSVGSYVAQFSAYMSITIALLINCFNKGDNGKQIVLVHHLALPVTCIIAIIGANPPIALKLLMAVYACGSLYVLFNHLNIKFESRLDYINKYYYVGFAAALFTMFVPSTNHIKVTAGFQQPTQVTVVARKGDSMTIKATLRGLDGSTKVAKIVGPSDMIGELDNISLALSQSKTVTVSKIKVQHANYGGLEFIAVVLCIVAMIRRLSSGS